MIENDRMYKNLENGKFILAAPETNKAFSPGGKEGNDQEELNGVLPQ